ncbi:MAG TPA: hypothetical protein VD927_03070 [Chryseosolibacter sp.]|nr:hypothetical protein [Chryseosolibacter sp.]
MVYFTIFVVMEAKYWIYIVIGAIWFLSRFFKKPEQDKENEQERPTPQPFGGQKVPEHKPQPMSFEELLREITEGKQARKPEPEPQTAYTDYDDNIREEEASLEQIEERPKYNRGRPSEEYEQAKALAFNRPSLEETMKRSDSKIEFGKFKAFEQQKQRDLLNEYTKSFQDPEGLRAAIVMSEILNRKF